MSDLKGRARKLLIFHTSGLDCAFPFEAVREIVPMARLSAPPGLPSGLAGFLNLRGIAIPILRLDKLFDLPAQRPGLHTPMIVLRGDGNAVGVLVDSVRAIVSAPAKRLIALPAGGTFQGCATAVFELNGDPVHLLSPAALLSAHETRLLADYCLMSQARLPRFEERT